jgi:hypothetical protein
VSHGAWSGDRAGGSATTIADAHLNPRHMLQVWPRPLQDRKQMHVNPMKQAWPGMNFLNPNEKVLGQIIMNDSKASSRSNALAGGVLRGNACENIWWDPTKVKAALVTCGGLCPGLNSIIQGVTHCLWKDYGVREILGITAVREHASSPGTEGAGGVGGAPAHSC